MRPALEYRDAKPHKFWWIHAQGSDFAVNYGKAGSVGTYEVKSFDDASACLQAAQQLLMQKLKKGYATAPGFDFDARLYFDDEETGLHPLTAHPRFAAHFSSGLYYDCVDEEAPFGSDEGSDTLDALAEHMRKHGRQGCDGFAQHLVQQMWDMPYLPPADWSAAQLKAELARGTEAQDLLLSDQASLAVALGCAKMAGRLSPGLQADGLRALRRIALLAQLQGWGDDGQLSETLGQIERDLARFAFIQEE